ncbi:hypothetical protein J7643_17340, partial [bacterium]|nr:hypothetical protein [bacterium]
LIYLGPVAAQATAQLLKSSGKSAHLTLINLPNEATEQSLAVFHFNGVKVKHQLPIQAVSDIRRFSLYGADRELMNNKDQFIRELSCLHGISESPRHENILETAYDINEELYLDAAEIFQYYY